MESDHYLLSDKAPESRIAAGKNGQLSIARYSLPGTPISDLIVLTGYNIMSDDSYIRDLRDEFPDTPIVFNSQVGARPPGSEGREGPGWRIIRPSLESELTASVDVPFDDLARSGIHLY